MGPGSISGEVQDHSGASQADRGGVREAKVVRSETGRAKECVLTIDGVDYRFAPIGTMVRVLAQEEITKRRRALWDEAVALAKDCPGDATKDLLLEAYRIQQRTVVTTIEESLTWLVSPEGDQFHFGLSIKKLNPSLSDDKIEELYDRATAGQLNVFREFQFDAYNPDNIQSALVAAAYLEVHPEEVPEDIKEHVDALIAMAKRMT